MGATENLSAETFCKYNYLESNVIPFITYV